MKNFKNKEFLHWAIWMVPIGILLSAFFLFPHGCHTLRFVVCGTSLIFISPQYYKSTGKTIKNKIWNIIFTFFAVLYNPIIPFYFEKNILIPMNTVTIIFYALHYRHYRKQWGLK